jgi:hypothetical protein
MQFLCGTAGRSGIAIAGSVTTCCAPEMHNLRSGAAQSGPMFATRKGTRENMNNIRTRAILPALEKPASPGTDGTLGAAVSQATSITWA